MKVKVIREMFGIPVKTIGIITTQEGEFIENPDTKSDAMWIKFDCKELPVGIFSPFGEHIAITREL